MEKEVSAHGKRIAFKEKQVKQIEKQMGSKMQKIKCTIGCTGIQKKLQQEHKDIKNLTGLWRENVNDILSDVDVHKKNGRLPQHASKEKLKSKAYPTSPKRSPIRL